MAILSTAIEAGPHTAMITSSDRSVDRFAGQHYSQRMDRQTEGILLAQARDGDENSFRVLVEANTERMIHVALRMVGSRPEAEDIAQEAFLRLYRSLDRFRGDSLLSTWLYRTVSRLSIDFLRREKIKRQIFFFRANNDDAQDPLDFVPSKEVSPEAHTGFQQAGVALNHALKDLSPRQRAVFTLRHFEELSLKEIAEALELEEGTIKAHLHRAVRQIREKLQEHRPEQDR